MTNIYRDYQNLTNISNMYRHIKTIFNILILEEGRVLLEKMERLTQKIFSWSHPSVKEKRYLREREREIGVSMFSNGTEEAV